MDPYKVLEVKRGSTRKQIKAAYRKLSRDTHPDLNPDIPDIEFKLVNWAYRTITNPDKAGSCPYREPKLKTSPWGTSFRKRQAQRKKPKPPPPNWGGRDSTLRYYASGPEGFYDEFRDHMDTAAPKRKRKPQRDAYRRQGPKVAIATVEEILNDDPQSEWQRKWAKKMKERCR